MKNAVSLTHWNEEEHIVSVLVHIQPEHLDSADAVMNTMKGVERVADDEKGKVVLLISASTARAVMQQIEAIQDIQGVLSAVMIAHHSESSETLNEHVELSDVLLSQNEEQQAHRRV